MKKRTGIVVFIISVIVIAACCLCAIFGVGKGKVGSASNIILGLDLRGGVSVTYEIQDKNFSTTDLDDTVYKLQLRAQEYSTDATVYTEGSDRITVEIPGVYDEQTVIDALGSPGSLQFVTYDENDDGETETNVWVTGADVSSAQAGTQTDSTTGAVEYIVSLTFTDEGAEKFAEATTSHVGESIYIIYDDEVVSYPTVKEEITSGSCQIDGMESYEAASILASTIRIGSLNLTLEEISSKVVSAKLGDNAVSTALLAGMIGLVLILILLLVYYRTPGLASAVSLIFYTAAMLLLLNAFDMTLTISGIAGVILSIGMGVDANVIINARIKEELQAGYSVDEAIKLGYKKSTSAILDGNITTLITAIVLLLFGSGSVQGFGQTLAVGIVLSIITSLVVSRILLRCLYAAGFNGRNQYAVITDKKRDTFDFIGKKTIWFIIAVCLVLAGILAMIINGASGRKAFNFSVEFSGGVSTTVEFSEDYSIDSFNDEIKPAIADTIGLTDIEGQKITGSTQYVIKTPSLDADVREEMHQMLVNDFGADDESFETTFISSSISREMLRDSFISLIIACVLMLIYIWIRFRRLRFAVSSVIALVHDVMIAVAFYAVFRMSVGNTFIACILTIVGYSINATIVIFDRVRENLQDSEINYDLKLVINRSVSQTITRNILTSATTFVMVLFLYILGVESMKAFALPLAIGIIAGAYSSIFLSGSLFYLFTKKGDRLDNARALKVKKQLAAVNADSVIECQTDEASNSDETSQNDTKPQKITANPNRKKKKKRKQ